ncbi:MAG: aldo/keto reductase [Halobacteriaceae archaeon]
MAVPTRTLPSGDELPVVGLGTWDLAGETLVRALEAAVDAGYTHLDTAEGYENETALGDAIAAADVDREDLFLTSKVLPKHLDYQSTIDACEASLECLGTDHLDLYLIHWPNPAVSLRETLQAMASLVDRGLVRNVGVSNFSTYQLATAHHVSPVPIAVNQVEFHPYFQQPHVREYAAGTDTVVEAAAPLARTAILDDETVRSVADARDRTPAQIVLRWALDRDAVVLPKSSSPAHVRENLDLFDWSLTEAERERLDALARDESVYYDRARDWTGDTYGIAE